jgi:hypothetical protein
VTCDLSLSWTNYAASLYCRPNASSIVGHITTDELREQLDHTSMAMDLPTAICLPAFGEVSCCRMAESKTTRLSAGSAHELSKPSLRRAQPNA